MVLLSSLFPIHEQDSDTGFDYKLGGALLGGTAPLILASLSSWLSSPLVSAYYLMFSSILGVICVVKGKKADTVIRATRPLPTNEELTANLKAEIKL